MTDVTNELILEGLKSVQSKVLNLEEGQREIRQELISIRGYITATQSDIANLHAGQSKIELRLERIENRIDIVNEPAE